MRKIPILAAGLIFGITALAQQGPFDKRVITGELIRIVPSLKDLKSDPTFNPPVTRDLTGSIIKKTAKEGDETDYGTSAQGDPVVQKGYSNQKQNGLAGSGDEPMAGVKVLQNFDGMGFTNVAPADPCMTNGPNYLIQMINGSQGAYFKVWDKNGSTVVAQTYMYQLIANPGYAGFGDPIVLYDQFADRWFLTEFGASGGVTSYANTLIFAVSQSGDPSAGWYIYKFLDNAVFIDYPHYAVWPHMIFGTSNDFNTAGTAYLGSSVMAFDKDKMIAGDSTATMIRLLPSFFAPGVSPASKPRTLAPVGISGNTPPAAGNRGLFMYYHDDNLTALSSDVDSIGIIAMVPDFSTPSNTTVTVTDVMVVAPFKSNVCASRNCIPSGGTAGYDAISDRFMHRVSYRNFGSYEAIVANYTVDANYPALPALAGLRWYEFRNNGSGWNVFQQGTYAPDSDGRWMGGININSHGQIALAFNHSGTGKFASIYFTGRNSSDPPGVMVYDEGTLFVGTAYGTFSNRWGDYNDLTTDVVNDSLFWFTAMYGAANWRTRISSFKLETLPLLDARISAILNPAPGQAQCDSVIIPVASIRNAGSDTLRTLNIYTQVDNGPLSSPYTWNGTLAITQSAVVNLPAVIVPSGTHTIRILSGEPNGGTDENKSNDTATVGINILAPISGPVAEGFESTAFPPQFWQVKNPNAGSITWQRTTTARKSGVASAWINFYNYSSTGHEDYLLSPILDVKFADSVILSFERAYKPYSTSSSFADGLAIVVSTDCGNSFTEIWRKEGVALSTVSGTTTANYTPAASDWQNTRLDLKPFIGSSPGILVGFKSINRFGNNLYLDDINIRTFRLPFRDAAVKNISEPFSRLCTRNSTPVVTLVNYGRDTLKSVRILYRINNNTPDSISWSGSLATGATAIIDFSAYNKTINFGSGGNFTFLAYTQLPNGLTDENETNDTGRVNVTIFDPVPDPVRESFESTAFPPADWAIASSGSAYTWERTSQSASERKFSAWIRNYRFSSSGKKDELFSPLVQISNPDSVYLYFDIANAASKFPGSTSVPLDTLEVLLTSDCGRTFRSIYKKWGEDLSTVGPNFPLVFPPADTIGFVPLSASQWRNEFVDITKYVSGGSRFQVVFRNSSNRGNNTYLDNINISTVTLPARLKAQGYLILPNPFENSFTVRHLIPPVSLRGIQVMNSIGQVVAARSFNRNAPNIFTIDMSRFANGTYLLKLVYDNKLITERIIKR